MRRLTCLIPPVRPLTYDCTLFEHQKFRRVRQLMSYLAPAVKEPNFDPFFHSMDITAAHKSATFPGNLEAWFPDYSITQQTPDRFSARPATWPEPLAAPKALQHQPPSVGMRAWARALSTLPNAYLCLGKVTEIAPLPTRTACR